MTKTIHDTTVISGAALPMGRTRALATDRPLSPASWRVVRIWFESTVRVVEPKGAIR
jgi:hypothetical protein